MRHSADEIIEREMRRGTFKNLPGQGKPLNLNDDPSEDPGTRAAHRLLKQNGFTLPWIEEGNEIDAALAAARARLQQSLTRYRAARASEAAGDVRAGRSRGAAPREGEDLIGGWWQKEQAHFRTEIADLNRRILRLNLEVPSLSLQRSMLNLERELGRIMGPEREP